MDDRFDNIECGANRNPNESESDAHHPNERPGDEGEQRQGPSDNKEQQPRHKSQHAVTFQIASRKCLSRVPDWLSGIPLVSP